MSEKISLDSSVLFFKRLNLLLTMRKYNPRIAKSNPLITVDKLFTFH